MHPCCCGPQIKYPNICYPMEDQCHIIPPARKHTKIKSSLNHPHLFDPNHLLIQEPKDKTSLSLDVHTVVYDSSFQCFFETRFLAIYTDRVEHQLNLDDFSFQVCQHKMDYVVTNKLSSGFQVMNMEIVDKTLPVYCYHGHLLDWPRSGSVRVRALFSRTRTLTTRFGPED